MLISNDIHAHQSQAVQDDVDPEKMDAMSISPMTAHKCFLNYISPEFAQVMKWHETCIRASVE